MGTRRSRQTTYRNVSFRSELEARWAVFFDAIHQPWLYEPRGFEFADESSYLPDFWLPGFRAWVEVKPARIDPTSAGKALKLAVESTSNVYATIGLPSWAHDFPDGQFYRFTPLAQTFSGYRIAHCEVSGRIGFTENGALAGLGCCTHKEDDLGHTTGRLFTATLIARIWEFKRT